ncbi:MAG: efflux RND transporter periplasmic adaptor subunit, partial [Gemmatimonadales bacterium]
HGCSLPPLTHALPFIAASAGLPLPLTLSLSILAGLAAACGEPAGPAGGPPAVAVEVVTLEERPVEQATDFVGTVKSRRSTTVQPQVEGFVTRIMVRSGDRVQPRTALMQIDPSMQQAAVASLESQRAGRRSDLQYARQEATRMKTLLEAGAASQSEMEQAVAALSSAEAQLEAVEAQIREQQVALAYHTVSAPTAGVVGDIPVRVGDSVTKSTALTTIDQNAGLEVYVNVPVQEAEHLRVGLPVHLLDDRGRLLSTAKLSFVSASVDPGTQSVLAKAWLEKSDDFRTDQFVRARMVWAEAPALTVPLVSVNRINGQYFAFVAESGEGGKMVARQRAVDLGAVVGNDYVVKSGLKPGEKLIVSGVQKIADGVPVTIGAPPAPASPSTAGGKGE